MPEALRLGSREGLREGPGPWVGEPRGSSGNGKRSREKPGYQEAVDRKREPKGKRPKAQEVEG